MDQTTKLSKLAFGHEMTPPINSRKYDREVDVAELAANIEGNGVLHAVNVVLQGSTYYVIDGNRRLAALRLLAKEKKIPSSYPVKIDVLDPKTDVAKLAEISLSANIMAAPIHPADAYVSYKEMSDAGVSDADIRKRFMLDVKTFRRIMALGKLSPLILDAWRRAGEDKAVSIEEEGVRAFTMASIEEQERVFHKLLESRLVMNAWTVRRELGTDGDEGPLLEFVGKDVYVEAGGSMTEDLFEDKHQVSDIPLLKRLVDKKLGEKCEELKADGWLWAKLSTSIPHQAYYSWRSVSPVDGTYAPELRAQSGCVVTLNHGGEQLHIRYGLIDPATVAKAPGAKTTGTPATEVGDATPAVEVEGKVSQALADRLALQLTDCAKDVIVATPQFALAALLASLIVGHPGGSDPVRVAIDRYVPKEKFADVLPRLAAMSLEELSVVAAGICSTAISIPPAHGWDRPALGRSALLLDGMDPSALKSALDTGFAKAAPDYFKSIPSSLILKAISEVLGPDEARRQKSKQKKDLVAYAMANVVSTGWLPPEMRTSAYVGPDLRTEAIAA